MRVRRRFRETNIVVAPCKRAQHVGPKNVARCLPTMLRPFAWAFMLSIGLCEWKTITMVKNV